MFHLAGPEQGRLTVYAHRALLADARHHLDQVLDGLTADGDLPSRGQVIRVDHGRGSARLTRLALPKLSRDEVILPDEVWHTVESNVHGVLAKVALLDRLGLGLDRGVLLHGEPGTGKTELVRTIASEVTPGATVLMPTPSMARERLPFVDELAQRLRPAIVVLEDLDLLLGGRHAGSNLLDFLAAVDGTASDTWASSPLLLPTASAPSRLRCCAAHGSTAISRCPCRARGHDVASSNGCSRRSTQPSRSSGSCR